MHTVILGTDFNKVSLSILEKLYFDQKRMRDFKASLREDAPIHEWVMLSTCNRMELYFVCQDVEATLDWIFPHLSTFCDVDIATLKDVFYAKHCNEAVDHLFRVATGTKSMVYGENEILGQVKQAYANAQELETTGPYLNKLFQSGIAIGKRVRDETNISKGAYSISSIAIEAIRHHFPKDKEAKILVIGTGTMGIRALKKLEALAFKNVSISNRNLDTSKRVSKDYGYSVQDYKTYKEEINSYDVVYFATSSASPIFFEKDISYIKRPQLLIDIGVPRNVDSIVGQHHLVQLITIDDLEVVAKETLQNRQNEESIIESILKEEKDQFEHWYTYKHTKLQVS